MHTPRKCNPYTSEGAATFGLFALVDQRLGGRAEPIVKMKIGIFVSFYFSLVLFFQSLCRILQILFTLFTSQTLNMGVGVSLRVILGGSLGGRSNKKE